jgi:hypothetical protein
MRATVYTEHTAVETLSLSRRWRSLCFYTVTQQQLVLADPMALPRALALFARPSLRHVSKHARKRAAHARFFFERRDGPTSARSGLLREFLLRNLVTARCLRTRAPRAPGASTR